MALSIKDPETDALVRKLASRRRTSFTNAIRLAVSNELATQGCDRAGAAYGIELPESHLPRDLCATHRGSAFAGADRDGPPRRSVPQSIFRSFKKFFGGD